MTKKELLYDIKSAKSTIRNLECLYQAIKDTVYAYIDATNNWDLTDLFDDFADNDEVEDMITQEMEDGGFERVYYLLNGIKELRDVYKVDNYGNLENITKADIDVLIESIKDALDDIGEETEADD